VSLSGLFALLLVFLPVARSSRRLPVVEALSRGDDREIDNVNDR